MLFLSCQPLHVATFSDMSLIATRIPDAGEAEPPAAFATGDTPVSEIIAYWL
jgi:hypothetical protein